jgi:hypothetical protein
MAISLDLSIPEVPDPLQIGEKYLKSGGRGQENPTPAAFHRENDDRTIGGYVFLP